MRNVVYLCVCVLALLVAACSPQKKNDKEDLQVLMKDSTDASGIQRMQVSDIKTTFTFKGKDYQSEVLRKPDDGLAVVKDEQGEKFADNSISLRITCGGKQIVDKVFTKQSFASFVDENFLNHGILEGLVFDKITPEGIKYAASICYPQTDLYVPLSLTITADGKISMAKEDLLEDVYDIDSIQ